RPSPCGLGARFAHSIASFLDATFISQYPAISSLVSANGPSTTIRLSPENRTRAPCELAFRPVRSTSTPALASSSLYFPIAASISSLGMLPASDSLLAFTIIMNRIAALLVSILFLRLVRRQFRNLNYRSDFDCSQLRLRNASGNLNGFVQIFRIHHEKAA